MGNCLSSIVKLETALDVTVSKTDTSERLTKPTAATTPPIEGQILMSPDLKIFSFSDLKIATRNFRLDTLLEGVGKGSVYKGWIDPSTFAPAKPKSGKVVAVKKLNQESFQGQDEWLEKVNYLGQFCHPNLVKLIGYCLEDENRLLVYEFAARGSLENHLFQRGSYFQPLSWILRLKVALGAAKGLFFLHNSVTKVIHRDLNASSILLDSNYNAKLSHFGLDEDGLTGAKSQVTPKGTGTYGYTAPEYLVTGDLTAKSDVYSFGVLLLEMLSGRRASDTNKSSGEQSLIEWAKPYLGNERKLSRVMDNRLEGQYTIDAASKVASLSLKCMSFDPKLRPEMGQVVQELVQLVDLKAVDDILRNACRPRKQSTGDAITMVIAKAASVNQLQSQTV